MVKFSCTSDGGGGEHALMVMKMQTLLVVGGGMMRDSRGSKRVGNGDWLLTTKNGDKRESFFIKPNLWRKKRPQRRGDISKQEEDGTLEQVRVSLTSPKIH